MASNLKVGGNVAQGIQQGNLGSVQPGSFAPLSTGFEANPINAFDSDVTALKASVSTASAEQWQSNDASAEAWGGNAGGDTEVINSGNNGAMINH